MTCIALTLAILVIGPVAAGPPKGRPVGPSPRVVNEVVDCLDRPADLDTETNDTWESESFDTSQFTRIAVRMEGDVSEALASITCFVSWQFSPEDTFQGAFPLAVVGLSFAQLGGVPPHGVGEVTGTRAKVTCRLQGPPRPGPLIDPLGDQPEAGSQQAQVTGTITDVKVLLRRF
jgi:hypothetical protein